MIERVSIADLGVIARAHLDLGPGLTALTGETGAGKTMVLTSLRLLLGHKADASIVRHGAERALVEGEWSVPAGDPARDLAADAGAEMEDDLLLVARSVSAQGRSRAHAGGRTVPAALLTDIGDGLVTVHGQADQLRLREPARQRAALDTFGGPEHQHLITAPAPQPGTGQLAVAVRAAGVNPVDWKIRAGYLGQESPLPHPMGTEVSGIVTAVGEGVADFAVGDEVLGPVAPGYGGFAEDTVLDTASTVAKPEEISFT
ncbi:MAG: alcohol dehydrogenase catalytic domain-containing protein, partial [Actinomycetaceae bacterium]